MAQETQKQAGSAVQLPPAYRGENANARGFIDAFFQNINWDGVNRRAEMLRRC